MTSSPPLYAISGWSRHYEVSDSRKVDGPLSWVAVRTKHDGLGFRRIAAERDRSDLFSCWMLMLQVGARQPRADRGKLIRDGQPLTAASLAIMTGWPKATFQRALEFLSDPEQGWLEKVGESGGVRIGSDASEPIPPTVQDRTGQDKTPKQTTAASPGELVAFPKAVHNPAGSGIPIGLDSEAFAAAWKDWKAHRSEIRHPIKETQEKAVLGELAKMGSDRAVAAIRHTIFKGWRGIREPDPAEARQHAQPPQANDPTKRQEPANWRELIRVHHGDHGPANALANGSRDWLQFVRSERELIVALVNAIPFDQRRDA